MNRLIIIGNGFDLAHGLSTSYKDFIEWYWDCWWKKIYRNDSRIEEDELCLFKLIDTSAFRSFWELWSTNPNKFNGNAIGHLIIKEIKAERICTFEEKSILLKAICEFYEENKWVDIENIYYQLLCGKTMLNVSPKRLNDDLDIIRTKLTMYLGIIQNGISLNLIQTGVRQKMFEPIKKQDIAVSSKSFWNSMLQQRVSYNKETWQELISTYRQQAKAFVAIEKVNGFIESYKQKHGINNTENILKIDVPNEYCFPDTTMLLNFNYTSTADIYFDSSSYNDRLVVNHIHGKLDNPNSMIFGYGDEKDEYYQPLVNKKENHYLDNIKSIKYLESPNYRQLLSFIDSDAFQIYIMGHSCGNSDRTLLNTLFEHKNCVSIKPYYHKRNDGTDNYMDLVQNISRNFTDMQLMRDRVVNKTYCESLSDK